MNERGYVIMAIDAEGDNYQLCAQRLQHSILEWHPDAEIKIVTATDLIYPVRSGFANDWQAWYVSPFRQTIKLEADMLITGPIDHWWTMFEHRDVVISVGSRDWQGNHESTRRYRKFIDDNDLPDVYNAITYWRRSRTAQEFWSLVRDIFEHYDKYKSQVRFAEADPSTDFVYAMAAEIMGREFVTLPVGYGPQITHMKAGITPVVPQHWTKNLVWELESGHLRINTFSQWGAFHYHDKQWSPHEQ